MAEEYAVVEFPGGARVTLRREGWESPGDRMAKLFNRLFPFRPQDFGPADGNPVVAHAQRVAERLDARLAEYEFPEGEPGVIY